MPKQSSIDLSEALVKKIASGVDPSQICRTCPRNSRKRLLHCTPELPNAKQKVVPQSNAPVLIQIGTKPKKVTKPTVVSLAGEPQNATGNVDTCGWEQLAKCKGCGHFKAIEATIPNPDGTSKYRQVIVGGYCGIGPEGVTVGTQTLYCVRIPRAIAVSEEQRFSCSTCANSHSMYETTMLDANGSPLAFDLTPYEMFVAQSNPDPERGIGGAVAQARRAKMQIPAPAYRGAKRLIPTWVGLRRTYVMYIAPGGITYQKYRQLDGTVVDKPISFKVIVPDTTEVVELFCDNDETQGIPTQIDDNRVAVEIQTPYHRQLNLPAYDSQIRKVLPREPCTFCSGNGIVKDPSGMRTCPKCDTGDFFKVGEKAVSSKNKKYAGQSIVMPPQIPRSSLMALTRINSRCVFCDEKWGACYYHQKAPVTTMHFVQPTMPGSAILAEAGLPVQNPDPYYEIRIEFSDPSAVTRFVEMPQRLVRYDRQTKQATDGLGNGVMPSMAKIQWRHWMANARNEQERRDVIKRVNQIMSMLDTTRVNKVNYGWIKFSSVDQQHPYCSLNQYDKDHGGHPDGESDFRTDVRVVGDSIIAAREMGVLTRGLDFTGLWNDQFGTPRGEQSTNPQRTHTPVTIDQTPLLAERMLIRDPKFCLPKWQARMEYERTSGPGQREQEQRLLNEGLLKARRQEIKYVPLAMPDNPTVVNLGYGLPLEAHVSFPIDYEAMLPNNYWVWASTKIVPTTLAVTSKGQHLLDFLDEPVFIPGSEKTRNKRGIWTTKRAQLFGYNLFNNEPTRDTDIPSVMADVSANSDALRAQEAVYETSVSAERNEYLVCSVCFTTLDNSGVFEAAELTDNRFLCPSGDGGLLIRRIKKPEWLEAAYRLDSAQMRTYVDPSYRRTPDGELVSPPNTTRWNTSLRLESMYCPNWRPKSRRR